MVRNSGRARAMVSSFRGLNSRGGQGRALASAHVFALLSASEGLPVAPLEALACGTPVVLSPGCGLPQVDGVAGNRLRWQCGRGGRSAAGASPGSRARAALGEAGPALSAVYRREEVVPELVSVLERVATSSSSAA